MSVAILVLAYREPFVLSQTVPVYRDAGFDIHVHLDAKAELDDYAQAMNGQSQFCHFMLERTHIHRGGFNMIKATMQLLRTALSYNKYSNFVLVSDDTIPVVPIEALRGRLSEKVERISLRRLKDKELFVERYEKFFFWDHIATTLRGRTFETAAIDSEFMNTIDRLNLRMKAGKVQIPLFYGSQWWSLTEETVRKILSLYEENTDLRESFEFSSVPDEMYIQTMVANFIKDNPIIQGPVYVDWSRDPKPFVFSSPDQYAQSIPSDQFFIRKVSSKHSEFIMNVMQSIS